MFGLRVKGLPSALAGPECLGLGFRVYLQPLQGGQRDGQNGWV